MAAGARRLYDADVGAVADRRGRSGTPRRRRARHGLARRSMPTTSRTRAATSPRATGRGSADGPSRRRSTWCAATSRASRCPRAIGSSERTEPGRSTCRDERTTPEPAACRALRRGRDPADGALAARGRRDRPRGAARCPRARWMPAGEPARDAAVPRSDGSWTTLPWLRTAARPRSRRRRAVRGPRQRARRVPVVGVGLGCSWAGLDDAEAAAALARGAGDRRCLAPEFRAETAALHGRT